MKYPIKLAMSQRVTNAINYYEIRDSLSHEWGEFLESIDLIGFPIPNKIYSLPTYLNIINPDGIILTGGNSVSPKLYGSNSKVNDVSNIRDSLEIQLIEYAIDRQLPLLGICRGMHMINVFFNGKLRNVDHNIKNHINTKHTLLLTDDRIRDKFKNHKIITNSYHNQGIVLDDLGDGIIPFALSDKDKLIEGIYHRDYPIIGLQWHPERCSPSTNFDRELMKSLFNMRKGDE